MGRRSDGPEGSTPSGLLRDARDFLTGAARWLWRETVDFAVHNPFVAAAAVAGLVRACGTTVDSGQTGLLFSFGRVKRRLEPGFHLMVPFLQRARIVPTRSRTLDLEDQRIVTSEGLVFVVRANLVWRIVEVEKALIEIDDLVGGMRQLLAMSVQEVLRGQARADLRRVAELDAALEERMAGPLALWGVEVERAGFKSIAPSERTLRVTQLAERVEARRRAYAALRERGIEGEACAGLVGTRLVPRRRALRASQRDRARRRRLRLVAVRRRVWEASELAHRPEERRAQRRAAREAERRAWSRGELVAPVAKD